jgi:outer membrane receptor protein involved in Fe transport
VIAPARLLPSSRRIDPVIRATRAVAHGTIALLALALALALARGVQAQGTFTAATPRPADLDLVYSASRYAQQAGEAPASVTIVTASEIREFGYRTLADVLGAVRGFSTRYDLNYDYVTVRGLARLGDFNTRILVLVDGQRTNAAVSDISNIGTDGLIDLAWIHHIEIIRGPGSAQFGANAFFGVINIVTGRGQDTAGGGRVEARVGSFGTYAGNLSWSTRAGASTDFMLAAGAARREGVDRYYPEFDTPATNNGIARGLDGEESWRLLSKGRSGDWSFEGAYAFRRRSVPTASYDTDFNSMLQTFDREGIANVTFSHSFEDLSRFTMTGAFNRVWYNGEYPYAPTTLLDDQRGNIWSLDAEYLRVIGPGHRITAGGELRWAKDGQQSVVEVTPNVPDTVDFLDVRSQLTGALFAQVEWRPMRQR